MQAILGTACTAPHILAPCRFVAGLQHCFQSWRKPFNPILGETWQATLSDGTELFLEQISHHPPISAFQMFGPGVLAFHIRRQCHS